MIPFLQYPWNDKIIEMKNRLVVARVRAGGGVERCGCDQKSIKGHMRDPCGDGSALNLHHCQYPAYGSGATILQDVIIGETG